MADDRTFLLIGAFRDEISPGLEKINNTITQLKQNLGSFGAKRGGFNDLTKSMGKVISAHIKLKEEVIALRQEMKASIPVFKEYRKEIGKTVSGHKHLRGEKFTQKNNPHLKFLDEATKRARTLADVERNIQIGKGRQRGGVNGSRTYTPRAYTPRGGGGGGGGGGGPRPVRGVPGANLRYSANPSNAPGAYSKERWGVSRDAGFAFGQSIGFTVGNAVTGAIVQGFQLGVGLLTLPFQHLAGAMKERIADESSDIQTAGAMFAISERKNMKMFSNFNEAIRAQQAINYKLAQSAAALPGATTEYVQMGKRVLDSMMTVLSKDVKGVSAFAAELGAKPGDQKDVLATLTQKFTEKAVLLGQGSSYRGAYGVPQLLEQLIGSQDISENMFNRYAQFRDLPIFQSVFRDLEGELAQTGAFSAERIRLVFRLLDEALPNEVIQAHKNTMAGFLEAMNSAFLDPEVGLFGMGRKLQGMQVAMVDQYGNFVNKQGKIVNSWDEAAKEQISLYESIQKILTGFGLPLSELASLLPQLFEPFSQLIKPLESTFKVAQSFYRNFNIYTKEFENLAKSFQDRGLTEAAGKMKRSAGARGSLLAIANLLTTFGDMTGGDFTKISKQLQDPNADIGGIAKSVMSTLLSSNFMEDLGFQIGLVIGGVVNTVAQMLGFGQDILGESRILKGIKAGFDSVDGLKAVQYIIQNVLQLAMKALVAIFKMAPLEFSIIGAIGLFLPAISAAISTFMGDFLSNQADKMLKAFHGQKSKLFGSKLTAGKGSAELIEAAAKITTGIGPGITTTGGTSKAGVIPGKEGVKPTIGKGGMGIGARLKALFQSIDEALVKVGQGLDEAFGRFEKGAGNQLGKLKGLFSLMRERLWNLGDALKKGAIALKALPFDLLEGKILIGSEIEGLANSLRKGISRMFDPLFDLIEGKYSIRGEIADQANRVRQGLGGIKGRLQQGLGAAAQGARARGAGLKVSVVSWGGKKLTALKGFGATIPENFTKGLKGKGGMLAAGVGIFDAIVALLSGESLGNALGKGAGPVLGSALGAALTPFFPPLGAFIGGWLGSLEAVTGPLGDTFSSIIGTLQTTFGFLAQVGGDLLGVINGIAQKIPGVSEGFNALEFAIFALLSPFKLLEIAISGLYDLYLTIKKNTVGLDKEEQKRLDERNTQRLTDEFTIQGRLRSGYSLKEQKAAEYAKWKEAQAKGDTEAMNRSAEYMRSITNLMQQSGLPTKGAPPKPGAPGAPGAAGGPLAPPKPAGPKVGYLTKNGVKGWQGTDGSWTPLAPKSSTQTRDELRSHAGKDIGNAWKALTTTPAPPPQANKTPNDISEINKKATEQAKGITQVHKGTEKTTTAVKELTAKITAQTSVQTTVAAIYNLLASGSLRVNGMMNLPGGAPGILPGLGTPGGGSVLPNGGLYNPFLNPGGIIFPQPNSGLTFPSTTFPSVLGDIETFELIEPAPTVNTKKMVSTNSGTMVEGNMTVNAPITINGAGQNAEEIATLVAYKIGEAVADARSASLFV